MNSYSLKTANPMETIDDGSTSVDDDMNIADCNQRSRSDIARSSAGSFSSSNSTTTNHGLKRSNKNIPPCFVCGAEAHGFNFDQISCESCKAFFRRNALKPMERFRCRNNDSCIITQATRKRCKRCRLSKCFTVGMRKDWILSDEEKIIKREKIVRNRMLKRQAQSVLQQQTNDSVYSEFQTNVKIIDRSPGQVQQSLPLPSPLIYMYRSPDQQMYKRQQHLLEQLSDGYQAICQQYPQPHKFLHRNITISQAENFDAKLLLIKDLTRELTQMTTSRLLNFFNLVPEFHLLSQQEKQSILIENMLPVFMFHGALTYNPDTNTFVDRTTADEPYDAKYLFYVYGSKVYDSFVPLAQKLISVTYQSIDNKQSNRHGHTLFLLLMTVLLFSDHSQANSSKRNPSKLRKIQQNYIDITCRFLHDQLGFKVGNKCFKNLVHCLPISKIILFYSKLDLQKLCSTLANVSLCEMAEDEEKASLSTTTAIVTNSADLQSSSMSSPSSGFSSTMICGTSHLNELQKENRTPPQSSSFNSISSTPTIWSAPLGLSNTATTLQSQQV